MLNLKKFHGDELLQIALILSLLRIDYDSYLEINRFHGTEYQEIIQGSSSAYTSINHHFDYRLRDYVHPKNIESMIINQQSIFYELNLLGRYNHYEFSREVTTYLLNDQEPTEGAPQENEAPSPEINDHQNESRTQPSPSSNEISATVVVDEPPPSHVTNSPADSSSSLTKEDMDLIEVLLKQDIDLGVTREVFDAQLRREVEKPADSSNEKKESSLPPENSPRNPWDGLNYTIDSETGEHVILPENEETNIVCDIDSSVASSLIEDNLFLNFPTEFENISLDNTIPLSDFNKPENSEASERELDSECQNTDTAIPTADPFLIFAERETSLNELEDLEEMIQATQLYMQPHGRQLQGRVPYLRTISMEQRWQDIANILSLPLPSEPDMHSSLAMVHGPPHNFSHTANSAYNNIDNCSTILLRNASLAPPLPDISNNVSFHGDIETPNLASAVAASLTTLTNSSEPMGEGSCHANFSTDAGSLVYPPHNHSEINQTTEGFLSSILNDEDLQLMDMAINEVGPYHASSDRYGQTHPGSGMYPMRMLENDDAMDTSSDSAVSSMDSEQVASLPDTVQNNCCHSDWMENGSDSSHAEEHNRYYGLEFSHGPSLPTKYRNYEYMPYPRHAMQPANNTAEAPALERPLQPVAQKKYQLFGKRFPSEQTINGHAYSNPGRNANMQIPESMKYPEYPFDRSQHDRSGRPPFEMAEGATAIDPPEAKFSCSMEFARQHNGERGLMEHIQHNHTYQLPPESLTTLQKPTVRDKHKKKILDQQMSRDEKRARTLKIPMNIEEIINLPMDEFNERLSKFDLTESQLALIRDIRRRGKNKVAAQNCRKRKLDQIVCLAEEVHSLQSNKDELLMHRQNLMTQRQRLKDKFTQLYRHVFQLLRDPEGNPYSLCEYSLQQTANGNVMLVPRNNSTNLELDPVSGAKAKKKDDPRK